MQREETHVARDVDNGGGVKLEQLGKEEVVATLARRVDEDRRLVGRELDGLQQEQ